MVVIVKGELKKKVADSAFIEYYRDNGWVVQKSNPSVTNKSEKEIKSEDEEWEEIIKEEELEKPLSEMTRKELEAKANELGIDLTGLGKTAQIREAIRSYIG